MILSVFVKLGLKAKDVSTTLMTVLSTHATTPSDVLTSSMTLNVFARKVLSGRDVK